MDKLLFLDIDGVLNNDKWFDNRAKLITKNDYRIDTRDEYIKSMIDPYNIKLLKDILLLFPDLKIVISSSWRGNMDSVYEIFKMNDIDCNKIIGRTKFHCYYIFDHSTGKADGCCRGTEIEYFLKEYEEKYNVSNYVILDDDIDMLYSQKDNFVHIDRTFGLQDYDVVNIVNILNK